MTSKEIVKEVSEWIVAIMERLDKIDERLDEVEWLIDRKSMEKGPE